MERVARAFSLAFHKFALLFANGGRPVTKGKGQVERDLASLAKPTRRLFSVTGLPWSGDHFLFFLGASTQA
jgi:hypothetical protein